MSREEGRSGTDAASRKTGDDHGRSRGTVPGEGSSGAGRRTYHCDLCGHPMLEVHCKLICERCGYKRDCSDP